MKNLLIIEVPFMTPAFDEVLALRDRILRKPLKLEFSTKDIGQEYLQTHLACYTLDFELLGCLTLAQKEEQVLKMRQVAIDSSFQRKGVGRVLVEAAEKWATTKGYKLIILNARDVAIPFYEHLGYERVGEPFDEVGILHRAMEKEIS